MYFCLMMNLIIDKEKFEEYVDVDGYETTLIEILKDDDKKYFISDILTDYINNNLDIWDIAKKNNLNLDKQKDGDKCNIELNIIIDGHQLKSSGTIGVEWVGDWNMRCNIWTNLTIKNTKYE